MSIHCFAKPDLKPFLQMYQDVLSNHRQQMSDLEMEQENRVVAALCDLWRVRAVAKLSYSKKCTEKKTRLKYPFVYTATI